MPAHPVRIALVALAVLAASCSSDADQATPVDTAKAVLELVAENGFNLADAPPTTLTVIDLKVGEGAEARAGDSAAVQYAGVSWSNGQMFDTSWQREMPFMFPLGQGRVITGWDEGVAGMREGGRRLLILPPEFAYGNLGNGSIGPGETLIFVVDLVTLE